MKNSNDLVERNAIDAQNDIALFENLVSSGISDNTRKSYQAALRSFVRSGLPLPSSQTDVSMYIAGQIRSNNSPATIASRLSALRKWHSAKNYPDPTNSANVQAALKGYKRQFYNPDTTKRAQIEPSLRCGQAAALKYEDISSILNEIRKDESIRALRDSALLLVGFFGVFRASEIKRIQCKSIKHTDSAIEITVYTKSAAIKPKARVLVANKLDSNLCPITALDKWISAAELKDNDYVFGRIRKGGEVNKDSSLSTYAISSLIKGWTAGINSSNKFSSHSLRRGFATSAARLGVGIERIQRQGNWQKTSTVMLYIDEAKAYSENPGLELYSKIDKLEAL